MSSSLRLLALLCLIAAPAAVAQSEEIGLSGRLQVIRGELAGGPIERTIVLIGGLNGPDESVARVTQALRSFGKQASRRRPGRLIAIPLANPDGATLQFPPSGTYREQPESHALWRWLGVNAPDLVLIVGPDPAGLARALPEHAVAEVGRIPARAFAEGDLARNTFATLAASEAHHEINRRKVRTPRQLAQELARYYGRSFDTPWYIDAVALVGRLRLGEVEDVQRLAEPYVDGTKNSLERPNSLVLGGHVVFTELARRTNDPRYLPMVRKIAELGFGPDGRMKESMPYHDSYSDSIFMATPVVAQAGALTGDRRYFDLAARHFTFMQAITQRPDGLYRHQPLADAAWGRGNAFVTVGLALTLSELPRRHPEFSRLRRAFVDHLRALQPHQHWRGTWRNVIDHPGAYAEYSATAMIGFAMARARNRDLLLSETDYEMTDIAVRGAWDAVLARTGPQGRLVDVCESTPRMTSLQEYLRREPILGRDARGGAMALLFATELANLE